MAEIPPRAQQLLANNKTWVEKEFKPYPTMTQLRQLAFDGKQRAIIILTCLDPRCVPEQYFGPDVRAGVIRNAGGRASPDVVRSVLVLRSLVDVDTVLVVHHTDCGMTHLSQEQIASEAKKRTPHAVAEIDAVGDFGCFTEDGFEDAVKQDVRTLRGVEALDGVQIYGLTFDLDDGLVKELVV